MNFILSEADMQFNESLNALEVLERMGFTEKSFYVEGDTIRLYCPIHKDQIRRSLLINKTGNRFKCSYAACPANKGGSLLEFYALYMGVQDIGNVREMILKDIAGDLDISVVADELIHSGQLKEARSLLEQAVHENPHNGIIRCKLAALLLEMNKKDEGIQQYFRAAEEFGICGELNKTLSIYNILVILGPGNIKVRRNLAYLYSRLGAPSESAGQLKWIVDHYIKNGEIDEAQQVCDEIIEMLPQEPEAYKMHANIQYRLGFISEGVKKTEKAAELHLAKGERDAAIEQVKLGLMFYPDKPSLVELLNRAKQTEEIIQTKSEDEILKEKEFMDWVDSITDSLETETQINAPAKNDTTEIDPRDRRVALIRTEIKDFDDEKIESMRRHLLGMFQDVRQTFEEGNLQQWEMKIIKEFYKSFCIALEQHKKDKNA